MPIYLTGALFGVAGSVLAWGGISLVIAGDTAFYLSAGLAYLLSAALVLLRRREVLALFAGFLAASFGWALFEAGLDVWALLPRISVQVLSAILLLAPPVLRRLDHGSHPAGRAALAAILLIMVGGLSLAAMTHPHRIDGMVPLAKTRATEEKDIAPGDWPHWGRTLSGQRFSPLDQITPQTISRLKQVWHYRTGDLRRDGEPGQLTYQATPLKIGNRLYLCAPHSIAIALDADSGREIWRFDAPARGLAGLQKQTCRGVAHYRDITAPDHAPCRERIYFTVAGGRLLSLDAGTGALCTGFGMAGAVNLLAGHPFAKSGFYTNTSPPLVVKDRLIIGGSVSDNSGKNAPSGVIRAYDARSGKLLWNFDAGRPDRTEPLGAGELYTQNSPNSWSVASADPDLGMVYLPMGNQVPDQLGRDRSPGAERFSSSILALDIETGRVRWVRQTVHHDLWDRDVPAQPSLLTLTRRDGTSVPALVAPTKHGDIFVLDRRTGAPLVDVREAPAPQGSDIGEVLSKTQPRSALSFMPPPLRPAELWGLSLFDQMACRMAFSRYRHDGAFTPPSLDGSIIHPGDFGVFNWGGVAVDPDRGILFGMPVQMAYVSRLIAQDSPAEPAPPRRMRSMLLTNKGLPYRVRIGPFLSPLGLPCQAPPWGEIAAADLASGTIVYRRPNGTPRDVAPVPLAIEIGVPGIGGPILTRGGVAFLAAAIDDELRAYDVTTGAEIWSARLPAGGQATPMTYLDSKGRQIVVIVAGGHGQFGTTPGDHVIAYALDGTAPLP